MNAAIALNSVRAYFLSVIKAYRPYVDRSKQLKLLDSCIVSLMDRSKQLKLRGK